MLAGAEPRPIRAVYTGMVPLVYKTQRQLLISLQESILGATVLIAIVMMFVLRNPVAGLISMIPNVFPIVVVFGALGWLGIKIDIGIMMTASVALGVAVDDTIHFLTWFRRGIADGLDRVQATLQAYDRCATAMMQTTLIGGLGPGGLRHQHVHPHAAVRLLDDHYPGVRAGGRPPAAPGFAGQPDGVLLRRKHLQDHRARP